MRTHRPNADSCSHGAVSPCQSSQHFNASTQRCDCNNREVTYMKQTANRSTYRHLINQQLTLLTFIATATIAWGTCAAAQTDPLPSWNDTAAKKAIVDFVGRITKEGASDFVKPEDRFAT